jgi:hypothetical protein
VAVGIAHDAVAAPEHARGIEVPERAAQRLEVARAIRWQPARGDPSRRAGRELAPLPLDALRGREQPAREAVEALRARLDGARRSRAEAPAQALAAWRAGPRRRGSPSAAAASAWARARRRRNRRW